MWNDLTKILPNNYEKVYVKRNVNDEPELITWGSLSKYVYERYNWWQSFDE